MFGIMRDKNPEMVAGEKKKFVMRPPQVVRVGSKKTAFANFTEIAKMLHRQPKHLLAFLFAELGTSGAIDSSNQLIIKGEKRLCSVTGVLGQSMVGQSGQGLQIFLPISICQVGSSRNT